MPLGCEAEPALHSETDDLEKSSRDNVIAERDLQLIHSCITQLPRHGLVPAPGYCVYSLRLVRWLTNPLLFFRMSTWTYDDACSSPH